jgi:cytochrome c oxidase subunit III
MSVESAAVPAGAPPGILGHHFTSLERQNEAVRLGMWLFLTTEILLFAGLFAAYSIYRFQFPEAFAQASRHLDLTLGTVNTVVLISSSFSVAMAIHFAREDQRKLAVACLLFTLACAGAFLVIKGFEYAHKFHEGALPGKYFTMKAQHGQPHPPGTAMFFTVYFMTTGLHGIHVIAGMSVLAWQTVKAWNGFYNSAYYTGLELGGLYWHLVDLVWIFLFPLLYLI